MQHARQLASCSGMACRRFDGWPGDMVVRRRGELGMFDMQRVDRGRSAAPLEVSTAMQISRVFQIVVVLFVSKSEMLVICASCLFRQVDDEFGGYCGSVQFPCYPPTATHRR